MQSETSALRISPKALPPRLIRTVTALSLFGFIVAGGGVAANDALSPSAAGAVSAPLASNLADRRGAWLNFALSELLDDNAVGVLLNNRDAELYRAAFEAQALGEVDAADAVMGKITDQRLMGHILAQRYLSKEYTTSYEELRVWLDKYADLNEAGRIHSLALKRRPRADRSALDSPQAGRGVRGGLPAAAVMGSGSYQAWRDGLEAWKQRDYALALEQFRQLARNDDANPWDQTAGAFWAARCLTRLGRPAEVTAWLRRAAAHPRTFYGLLANRQLGVETDLNWAVPDLSGEHLMALAEKPAGSRALALLQIGQLELAEVELRSLQPRRNDSLEQALVAIASTANLPGLAMRLGTAIPAPDGALYDAALYPLPRWEPEEGFKIDRALIFALVRQESQFNTAARSHAGATGLMQLMPRTASYVAGRPFDRANLAELHDPELNLTLGQKYVEYLLNQGSIDNNLFYLLAAYNSGPGMVRQWQRNLDYGNDPLLFIETVTASETRDFIERVLANYWIYQLQLGHESPSLDAVASGEWPIYEAPKDDMLRVADSTTLN